MMKKVILSTLCSVLAVVVLVAAVLGISNAAVPEYTSKTGYEYTGEKVKGEAVIRSAAEEDDTIFLFGSSELSTTMIKSHPANFFTKYDFGFDVCTVGRGSSQSLIHALILAGNGESLRGKKVVFMISPQHFVEDGIAPDMFVANFSEQQYLDAMMSDSIGEGSKAFLSGRVRNCFDQYEAEYEDPGFESSRRLADQISGLLDDVPDMGLALMKPYYALESVLFTIRDNVTATKVIKEFEDVKGTPVTDFDWDTYRQEMIGLGAAESDNNEFGILNDYYNTNIGKKLARMENKDADLSYSESIEYEDLQNLIWLCDTFEIDALFVHTPLHGTWSDYCGFTADERQEYYDNVRAVLDQSGYDYLDLTAKEYDSYYLCDVMHIGWLGWVDINEAICKFYYENQ